MNPERERLEEDRQGRKPWRKWGPYLSERQWGTVREDYSADGNAWNSFSHEQARSRAYRWGEDGLAGICDDQQRVCLAPALWNGRDPILKERIFGLPNGDGNHGEDCKDLYYYLDGTPTASYLKMLYKYPQAEFPYGRLTDENRRRGKHELEFELLETGVFDGGRYFDVFVEYAKAGPDDLLMLVTAHNRGPDAAELHVLPQLWFRNTWAWKDGVEKPSLRKEGPGTVVLTHPCSAHFPEERDCHAYDDFRFHVEKGADLLFCENDTNRRTAFGFDGDHGCFKDGVHEAVVHGRADAVNPDGAGT
ncbi:MAG: MGH1-like glycoside hydrolase domain-containing protein, partial [Planctomycetia bacterium]